MLRILVARGTSLLTDVTVPSSISPVIATPRNTVTTSSMECFGALIRYNGSPLRVRCWSPVVDGWMNLELRKQRFKFFQAPVSRWSSWECEAITYRNFAPAKADRTCLGVNPGGTSSSAASPLLVRSQLPTSSIALSGNAPIRCHPSNVCIVTSTSREGPGVAPLMLVTYPHRYPKSGLAR